MGFTEWAGPVVPAVSRLGGVAAVGSVPFKLTSDAYILDYGEPALICKQHDL